MPLSFDDWREIQKFVNSRLGEQGQGFVQGKVVKNDTVNRLVWIRELGDQPIPLISFDYQVSYYYDAPTGVQGNPGDPVNSKTTLKQTPAYSKDVKVLTPRVGDLVLVALHFGSVRLPKCLGVIKSKKYVGGP